MEVVWLQVMLQNSARLLVPRYQRQISESCGESSPSENPWLPSSATSAQVQAHCGCNPRVPRVAALGMKPHEQQDIIAQVRDGDYDRFLAIQLAPAPARAGLYAVTAFHIELARIAEIVSEALIGHIRLAWWREALEEIEAGKPPRNHPVVLALAALHPAHPQIFPLLQKTIEARAADLDTSLIAHEPAWLEYCDSTAGALHMAWAQLMGINAAQRESIRTQARAYAMIGHIRAIPFMHHQGWLRFPHARMNAAEITSLEPSDRVSALGKAVVADALALLAEGERKEISKPLRALASLAALHARQLQRAGFNPYELKPNKLAAVWQVFRLYIT